MRSENRETADEAESIADAVEFAMGPLTELANENLNAGIFDRTAIERPNDETEYERSKIEKEFEGMRGLANTFWDSVGFQPNYQEEMSELPRQLDQLIGRLKIDAGTIEEIEHYKAHDAGLEQKREDQSRLNILKQRGAGNEVGADRSEIDSELTAEENSLDPHDNERLSRLHAIHQQTLANFDADAARRRKLEEAQADDRIAELKEEGYEAELQGEGKTDEATAAHLKFATDLRVRQLREQAEIEIDPEIKQQLQRQADAAQDAGAKERDALQREQQRHNSQVPPLNSAGHGGTVLDDALANKLTDAAKKLDDAATKLGQALSGNRKTLTSVKD